MHICLGWLVPEQHMMLPYTETEQWFVSVSLVYSGWQKLFNVSRRSLSYHLLLDAPNWRGWGIVSGAFCNMLHPCYLES